MWLPESKVIDVTPLNIRDYAMSYGWTLVRDALPDHLFVLNSPEHNVDFRQLLFSTDGESTGFNNQAILAINRLSEWLKRDASDILEEIREVTEDVISLRYFSENKLINSISFIEAWDAIDATKQMILSAGSSVVSPALYHKRLSRAEAVSILNKTKFRHTKEGSFIIKIACPIDFELPAPVGLFGDEPGKPTSRRAFELIRSASRRIIEAVEEDSIGRLLEEEKESERPELSYNLCDAIVGLYDEVHELPFELGFTWSRAYLGKIPSAEPESRIKFPFSFKPKIEELKSYLEPKSYEAEDVFFGTVESLSGNEGNDGRRMGEVTLALFVDGNIVNAKVSLEPERYELAWKAHGETGALVKIRGRLLPGRRLRSLDEVSLFEIVQK